MKGIASIRKQRGITLIGFIMVMIVAGFFAFMAMKLVPIYSEYEGVVSAMKDVANESGAANANLITLQRSLQRHFDVGYVDSVKGSEATLIRSKDGNQLNMTYEVRTPFVYNIDLVVSFDHTERLNPQSASE